MKNEIVLYQSNELTERIEVRIEDETVWLTQQLMATLFMHTKQNISLHINNCFKEKELEKSSTVKDSLTVQKEGQRSVKRKIEYYNLDVIISVGYRVKSKTNDTPAFSAYLLVCMAMCFNVLTAIVVLCYFFDISLKEDINATYLGLTLAISISIINYFALYSRQTAIFGKYKKKYEEKESKGEFYL